MVDAAFDGQRGELLEGRAQGSGARELLVVGTSYKTSDLEFREAVVRAFSREGLGAINSVRGVRESALLSTCNRLELYVVTDSPALTRRKFDDIVEAWYGRRPGEGALYSRRGPEAVAHLFRVAAGLDSVMVGEPQILSQVRSAGIASRKAGNARGILSPLFDRASRVGARVRSSYGLGSGEDSLSDLAVDMVLESAPKRPAVLLVGTGKMVQLSAGRLDGRARKFYVASKRRGTPKWLANSTLVSYKEIPKTAAKCDVVISATTCNEPLLRKGDLAGRKRRVVVDLGMPRNVSSAVRELRNVRLIDLDDLAKEARSSKGSGKVRDAEGAVAGEATEFYAWLVQTRLSSTLSELFAWANDVREEELRRTLRRMGRPSARDRRIVEAMGRRIVSKLMARPAEFARGKRALLTEEEKLNLLRSVFGTGGPGEGKDSPRD